MRSNQVLITAFLGTSAEVLVRNVKFDLQYKILYLPNDKKKDSELLIAALEQEEYDTVISIGQCPNIKDKVHIEMRATKGDLSIDTAFECEKLKEAFEQAGLVAKLSYNAGTSFCNELYWNGLQYLKENKLDTKMVFLHVPFGKNISDAEVLKQKLYAGLKGILYSYSKLKGKAN